MSTCTLRRRRGTLAAVTTAIETVMNSFNRVYTSRSRRQWHKPRTARVWVTMSAHRPTRGAVVAAAAVAVLVTGIIRRRVELWRGSGRRGHGTRARRGGKGARARRKKRRRANARQGGGGKGGDGSGGGNVTLFVTGLPRAIRGKSIMWTLRDVFKPCVAQWAVDGTTGDAPHDSSGSRTSTRWWSMVHRKLVSLVSAPLCRCLAGTALHAYGSDATATTTPAGGHT